MTAASENTGCVHCGAPVGRNLGDPGTELAFCCSGCEAAYSLIQGLGLDDFYALRSQSSVAGTAQPGSLTGRYEQFDTPEYLGPNAVQTTADGLCSVELAVQGLHCAACSWLIEKVAQHEPGLVSARVKLSQHTVRFIFDPQSIRLSEIAALFGRLGYQLFPHSGDRQDAVQLENRQRLIAIAIAGFLAANAMWIAIALYAGGIHSEYSYFLNLIGSALGFAAVAGPGRTFLAGAWTSLRARSPHMDLPVALGLSVGAVACLINAIRGQGEVYFDSLTMLVFLLLIGRWVQFRQQHQAVSAIDLMLRLTPQHAQRVDPSGQLVTVRSAALTQGDIVLVAAGDNVPVDGRIVEGSSSVDKSLLTGESRPEEVCPGDLVYAGTLNMGSPLKIETTAIGEASRIGSVVQSIQEAATERTPIVLWADRIGGYFVSIVTVLAVLAFLIWLPHGLTLATSHATALLIVACPCALALATPLAIAVAIGRAAQRGILIREGNALQSLTQPGIVWLDKTGTLTEGRQRVTTWFGDPQGLQLAAALESHCKHPISAAIRRAAEDLGTGKAYFIRLDQPDVWPLEPTFQGLVPGGLLGHLGERRICVGNLELMRREGFQLADNLACHYDWILSHGQSPILIGLADQVITVLGLTDPLRSDAPEMVQDLRSLGWELGILSGDHQAIVQRVGAELGLDERYCMGDLTPEQKLAEICRTKRAHTVVMVGDGANDAAALAAADVGIAVRGGAQVSLQAAPVYISSTGLRSLPLLFTGAGRTTQLIYWAFAASLTYNLVAVALALFGLISPLVAALLMPLSSVTVLSIVLSRNTFPQLSQADLGLAPASNRSESRWTAGESNSMHVEGTR